MSEHRDEKSISRRQLIKRGAIAGSAAIWVPPVIQSLRMPAYGQVGSPPPVTCIVDGFMTGGGFLETGSGLRVQYDLRKLDCPPQTSPPELKVSWTTGSGGNKVTYVFEALAYVDRTCSDNPNVANGPEANFDTVVGDATGTLTIDGVTQNASVHFEFLDGGEGNTANDTVTLVIFDAGNNAVITVVNALVDGGNLQAHHGNFAFGEACP